MNTCAFYLERAENKRKRKLGGKLHLKYTAVARVNPACFMAGRPGGKT